MILNILLDKMENLIAHGNIFYSLPILIIFLMLIIGAFVFYEINEKKLKK